jgi:peptide/nickel transport system substrate-binding protein
LTYVAQNGSNPLTNPHTYTGGLTGWEMFTQLYDRVIQLGTDNKTLQPMLAKSWTWNAANTQLTLNLRDDVMFQDGTPFNASVAVQNLQAAQAPGSNGAVALSLMTSAVAAGPYTVQLNFSAADPDVVFALEGYPGMMVSPAGLAKPPTALASDPAGSGPYKLESISSALTFTYDRFDGYWNKSHVYPVKYVETNVASEQTRLNAVKTGQGDYGIISGETWSAASADTSLQTASYQAPTAYVLFMNTKTAPFNNPQVRQAVAMAVDRASLNAADSGLCTPVAEAFAPGMSAYDPSLKAPAFDPAQAKQLIQQAGAAGTKLKMLSITIAPYPALAGVIQNDLDAIGLNVQIDVQAPGGTFRQLYQQGADPLLMAPTSITFPDTSQILDMYVTGFGNPGVKDPALAAQIQHAEGLPIGSPQRNAAMQAINTTLTNPQSSLWVSLCAQKILYVGTKKVIGLQTIPHAILSNAAVFNYLQIAKS